MPAVPTGGASFNFQAPQVGAAPTTGLAPNPQAPPGTSSIPGAYDIAGADALALKAYQNALAQVNQGRTATLQQYGYLGDINPTTGELTNLRVDPHNPYGAYQQMLKGGDQAKLAAEYAAQGRGLGSGGLAAQGITAAHQQFGADSAQMGQNIMNSLEGLQQTQTDAQQTYNDALWQAQQQATAQAIAAGAFDTAPAAPAQPYGQGATGSALPKPTTSAPKTTTTKRPTSSSVKVTANKTGASANKKQGIYAIH